MGIGSIPPRVRLINMFSKTFRGRPGPGCRLSIETILHLTKKTPGLTIWSNFTLRRSMTALKICTLETKYNCGYTVAHEL